MDDVDRSARSENREYTGFIKLGGICGVVLDLEAGTESMNTYVYQVTGSATYLCTSEERTGASDICDVEAILGEGAQNSTGIVEEFEGPIAGVGDRRGDLQVLQSVNLDVWGRCLDSQPGGGRDCDHGGDEGNEGSAEVRGEHHGEGSEGG